MRGRFRSRGTSTGSRRVEREQHRGGEGRLADDGRDRRRRPRRTGGIRISPATSTTTSATPFAIASARCWRTATSPSCQACPMKTSTIAKIWMRSALAAPRNGSPPNAISSGRAPERDREGDEEPEHQRRLRHRLERRREPVAIVSAGDREQRQRGRQHQRGQAPEHLERAERRPEVARSAWSS